jgi:type II secretory pathway component GspD/PulD (secretin)
LTAAASKGKVKILSDPKVATMNGKQATINITTQVPYATSNISATGAATTTINYTTTGIQLTVTPVINADGRITLHLNPNISQPSATQPTGGAAVTAGAVSVDTRQADTNVVVRDGETIVIGGIITDQITNNESSIPFFGDIPILGWLFKAKHVARQRVELLIFVTPKLLAD